MTATRTRPSLDLARADNDTTLPSYELRAIGLGGGQLELSIWQRPTPATPRLTAPECTGTLKGRALQIVETRICKRLKGSGIRVGGIQKGQAERFHLDEDEALNLALLFRVLAPMRSIDRIRMVADGIDKMSREEAGYWLGMAVHRVYPRRVLAALRLLLTTP